MTLFEKVFVIAGAFIVAAVLLGTLLAELGRLVVAAGFTRLGEIMIRVGSDTRGAAQTFMRPAGTASVSAPHVSETAPAVAIAQRAGTVPSSTASPEVVSATIVQGQLDSNARRDADADPPAAPPPDDSPKPPPLPLPPDRGPGPLSRYAGLVLVALLLASCASRRAFFIGAADAGGAAGEAARPVLKELCADPMGRHAAAYEAAKRAEDAAAAAVAQGKARALIAPCDAATDAQALLLRKYADLRAALLASIGGELPPGIEKLALDLAAAGAKLGAALATLKGGAP